MADRHDFQRVNVDVGRQGRDPEHRLCDILRRQRIGTVVDLIHLAVVAFEAHVGKFGATHQARFNIGHTDAGTV
ncbi:hypothetical protein D3C71_2199400 [compost metagenome]